jgi:hypothetical protein
MLQSLGDLLSLSRQGIDARRTLSLLTDLYVQAAAIPPTRKPSELATPDQIVL